MNRIWLQIRRAWITFGLLALAVLCAWSIIAYCATDEAHKALRSNEQVIVQRGASTWLFLPVNRSTQPDVGLVFFPGALVEPAAYAPLAQKVAAAGYVVLLIEVPRRGIFGGADGNEVLKRARSAMKSVSGIHRWVIAGHSRGAAIAARMVHVDSSAISGLVLIGSSHPRDFSLADTKVPVTKVYGTRDGVAKVVRVEETRGRLPPSTRWVRIEGGNHSQFGYYGFQLGDRTAQISREQQQEVTFKALLESLITDK